MHYVFLSTLLALSLTQLTACGSGAGSEPMPAPSPSVNPPFPPLPQPVSGPAVEIAQLSTMGPTDGCTEVKLTVEPNGDFTAFWCDSNTPSNINRLVAARVSGMSLSPGPVVPIEQDFTAPARPATAYSVMRLQNGRFLVSHALTPRTLGAALATRVRVLDMAAGTVTAAQTLPANVQVSTPVIQDRAGQLFGMVSTQLLPFPVFNLGGLSLTIAAPAQSPVAINRGQSFVYASSLQNHVQWAVIGFPAGANLADAFVTPVNLSNGAMGPLTKLSGQSFELRSGPAVECQLGPFLVETTGGSPFAAWGQKSDRGFDTCDLFSSSGLINKYNVNDVGGGNSPKWAALTGGTDAPVAVWFERPNDTCSTCRDRIRWSQRNSTNGTWSVGESIDSAFQRPDISQTPSGLALGQDLLQSGVPLQSGPNQTLCVAWDACQSVPGYSNCHVSATLLSKFVGGQWIHRVLNPTGRSEVLSVAINAAGQGVALVRSDCAVGTCKQLSAYRF